MIAAVLSKLLSLIPGLAPVDFKGLSKSARAQAEARLARPAKPLPPAELVAKLDRGSGAFRAEHERVVDEVKRRCKDAEVWQSFYLDLLDEEGVVRDEGEGVGAEPVEPDEELRRLLAGVALWPQVRSRYAWEIGYHLLRYSLSTGDEALVREMADAAAEDFLLAYDGASDLEAKVSALGDLAGALFLAGQDDLARTLCDYGATVISAEEAVKQDLHRLRREGAVFVRESYGVRR